MIDKKKLAIDDIHMKPWTNNHYLLALLLLILAGCSGKSLTKVTGEVVLDDVPVACGVISFLPADGAGPSAQAVIQDGKYTAEVSPGIKNVKLELAERKSGQSAGKSNASAGPVYETVSPVEYHEQGQTNLQREIPKSSTVQNFRLKSS
jgi:hypothetical protein